MLGASQRAQVAGDAHGLVGIGIDVQPGRSTIALRHLWTLQRILLGVDLLWVLIAKGDFQTLEQIDEEDFAQQAGHPHIELKDIIIVLIAEVAPEPCLRRVGTGYSPVHAGRRAAACCFPHPLQ